MKGALGGPEGPQQARDEAVNGSYILPDAALHAIVALLSPPALGALRLASRAWADGVARCLDELSLALPSAGHHSGCCRQHVQHQRSAAVAVAAARFGGVAALRLRACRAGAAQAPPLAAPQFQRQPQAREQEQHAQAAHQAISLEQLAALPRCGRSKLGPQRAAARNMCSRAASGSAVITAGAQADRARALIQSLTAILRISLHQPPPCRVATLWDMLSAYLLPGVC